MVLMIFHRCKSEINDSFCGFFAFTLTFNDMDRVMVINCMSSRNALVPLKPAQVLAAPSYERYIQNISI